MLSIVIPTMQKNIHVLNLLVMELVDDLSVDEIIIIDNSQNGYKYESNKVKVFIPKTNLYVNPSWNFGIKNIKNDYFGILNDDIILPKNFCSQVYDFLNSSSDIGLVGLDSSILENSLVDNFYEYPSDSILMFKQLKYSLYTFFWGSAIFGKRENYYMIPENIRIWCGDNYLIYKNLENNKKNYQILNANVKHLISLTSGNKKFKKIKEKDLYNFSKIDSNFKNHDCYPLQLSLLEKIFSIKNAKDKKHKMIVILGIKIFIRLPNKN